MITNVSTAEVLNIISSGVVGYKVGGQEVAIFH